MNLWTKLLLHLRRAKLRHLFIKNWPELEGAYRQALLQQNKPIGRQWLDVEWITEPILHVLPDTTITPVALVGVAAMYELIEDDDQKTVQTQAGTALFAYEENSWTTHGTLLLNLTPSEALRHLEKATSAPA